MSRVKQFLLDVFSPLRRLDTSFVASYLNEAEASLFNKLRKAEQLHAVQVAKDTLNALDESLVQERDSIAKACLLHDVGKIHYAMGPLGKTYVVLFAKKRLKSLKGTKNFKDKPRLDIYFNHPSYGVRDLRAMDSFQGQDYFYDLVAWHHEPDKFYKKYSDEKIRHIFGTYRAMDERN